MKNDESDTCPATQPSEEGGSEAKPRSSRSEYMPKSNVSAIALWIADYIRKHGYLDCGDAARKVEVLFGDQFMVQNMLKMYSDRRYFLSRINRFSSNKVFYHEATNRLGEAISMEDERIVAAELFDDRPEGLPSFRMATQRGQT